MNIRAVFSYAAALLFICAPLTASAQLVNTTTTGSNPPNCAVYAVPTSVNSGDTTTLHWATSGTSATMSYMPDGQQESAIGPVDPNGQIPLQPLGGSITYFITASSSGGTAKCGFRIVVLNKAESFTANPQSGSAPLQVTFSAETNNVTYPGGYAIVYGDNGQTIVSCGFASEPSCPAHTYQKSGTYTVHLYGVGENSPGKDYGTVTITVTGSSGGSARPPTCSLNANPFAVRRGNTSNLTWTSTNASTATLTSIGAIPVNGTQGVIPTGSGTTYVATFTGPGGTVQCRTTVSIQQSTIGGTSGGGTGGTTGGGGTGSGGNVGPLPHCSGNPDYDIPGVNCTNDTTSAGGGSARGSLPHCSGNPDYDIPGVNCSNSGSSTGGSLPHCSGNPDYDIPGVNCSNSSSLTGTNVNVNGGSAHPQGIVGAAGCKGPDCQACNLVALVQAVIKVMLGLSVPIFALLLLWAGALFATSGANPNYRIKAKSVLKTAGLGFLIAISGYLIINTILNAVADNSFGTNVRAGSNWFSLQCVDTSKIPVSGDLNGFINSITNTIQNGPGLNTTGISGGPLPVDKGDCSPGNIQNAAYVGGYTLTQAQANTLSCISVPESGCNNNASATGSSGQGAFQVVFGYNDQCHNLNISACTQAANAAGYNISGNMNCSSAFSGGKPKPGMENLANACNAAAHNFTCNASAAACLLQKNPNGSDWTADPRSSAQKQCIAQYNI